jgi:predicted DNA binding protein
MWVTSILTKNTKSLINHVAHKHNVSLYGYPLNIQKIGDEFYVTFYGWVNASPTKTSELFKDLEGSTMVCHVEQHDQAFIVCMQQPKETAYLYSHTIIYLKPIFVQPNFTQEYVVASWNRKDLNKILQMKIPNVSIKLNYIKQQPLQNIGLFAPTKLTTKQQAAFNLAQKEGYYVFPKRGVHLKDLAKKSNLSLATYQAHLRKAEQKILNTYRGLQ